MKIMRRSGNLRLRKQNPFLRQATGKFEVGLDYYEGSEGFPPHPCWVINYDIDRALHNFGFLQNLSKSPVRIYTSTDCAAIVVSNMSLEEISEPHVMAWRNSFRETSEQQLRRQNARTKAEEEEKGFPGTATAAA